MIKNNEDMFTIYSYLVSKVKAIFLDHQGELWCEETIANIADNIECLRQCVKYEYGWEIPKDFYEYKFDEETSSLNLDFISLDEFKNWYIEG